MRSVILTRSYDAPPLCEREILRYAGCRGEDSRVDALLRACIGELEDKLSYKVCYCELSANIADDICDFGFFELKSARLAANLEGCDKVILFGATVGVEIDRLIAKYGRISPVKALMFQAIGSERIEALCDVFCQDISKETGLAMNPRFSPGYGDLPLDAQRNIFSVLDCGKRIGLFLNSSLLMSPSKSVTAFAGLCSAAEKQAKNKCCSCDKKDCAFRCVL